MTESHEAAEARRRLRPFRDVFAVLFFVSAGMLCNPRALVDAPVLVACSTRTFRGRDWTEEVRTSDAVLDVEHIVRWAPSIASAPAKP